ncbi:hypothetical protein OPV22_009646 [Ensete ventricosum]|uniref:Uncharacterized protein n=1 Tax=Ensete ventricosum TaxID=4639 RepID=A0AAV8RHF5_ENSVE|nr:hypothetical protein OPV22_009646 [Ensete ventricosum]
MTYITHTSIQVVEKIVIQSKINMNQLNTDMCWCLLELVMAFDEKINSMLQRLRSEDVRMSNMQNRHNIYSEWVKTYESVMFSIRRLHVIYLQVDV